MLKNAYLDAKIGEKATMKKRNKMNGAKVRESCRSRKMLKNAYLDAKIGFDTAENEPSKVRGFLTGVGGVTTFWSRAQCLRSKPNISQIFQPNHQTLEGSFSAVSTPIFASKYAFFSIFRDLQDSHTFAPLRNSKFADFCKIL